MESQSKSTCTMAKIEQGYIVLVGTFLCRFVGLGLYYSGGLFLTPLSVTFGIENATAALYMAIYGSTSFMSSYFSGYLQDKLVARGFSVRPVFGLGAVLVAAGMVGASYCQSFALFLFCAVFIGIGIGFTCFSAGGVLTLWFDENRGRNLLLAMSGGGIGSFVYAQVIVAMMSAFHEGDEDCRSGVDNPNSCAEWRLTFRYLGLCSSIVLLVASYFMKNHTTEKMDDYEDNDNLGAQLRSPSIDGVSSLPIDHVSDNSKVDDCKDTDDLGSQLRSPSIDSVSSSPIDRVSDNSGMQGAEITQVRRSRRSSFGAIYSLESCYSIDFSDGLVQLSFRESIRTKTFVLLCLWALSMAIVLDGYSIFVPSYAEEIGLSPEQGGLAVSVAGLALLAGNLTLGYIADLLGNIRSFQLCMTGLTIMSVAWPFCRSLGSLLVISIGVGFCSVTTSLYISILADVYGVVANDCFFSIVGLVSSLQAPGVFVGPVVIGILIDKFGYYAGAFFCAGVFAISLAIILALPTKESQLKKINGTRKALPKRDENLGATPKNKSEYDASEGETPFRRERRRSSHLVISK